MVVLYYIPRNPTYYTLGFLGNRPSNHVLHGFRTANPDRQHCLAHDVGVCSFKGHAAVRKGRLYQYWMVSDTSFHLRWSAVHLHVMWISSLKSFAVSQVDQCKHGFRRALRFWVLPIPTTTLLVALRSFLCLLDHYAFYQLVWETGIQGTSIFNI